MKNSSESCDMEVGIKVRKARQEDEVGRGAERFG